MKFTGSYGDGTGGYGDGTGSYGDGRGYVSYDTAPESGPSDRERAELAAWEAERGSRRLQVAEWAVIA